VDSMQEEDRESDQGLVGSLSTTTEEHEEVSCAGQVDDAVELLFLPPASTSSVYAISNGSSSNGRTNGVVMRHDKSASCSTTVKSSSLSLVKLPIVVEEAPLSPSNLGRYTHLDMDRSLLRRLLYIGSIFA